MAEKEYIDREAFKRKLIDEKGFFPAIVARALDEMPAADVVEVKRGKWIYDPDGTDWELGAWLCDLCKCKNDNLGGSERINPLLFAGSKYCPNCGARMDGKEE